MHALSDFSFLLLVSNQIVAGVFYMQAMGLVIDYS